jgi:hypothetical protein
MEEIRKMQLKTMKQRHLYPLALALYALALAVCIVAPMLLTPSAVRATSAATGVFSAVQSGTTNVNTVIVPLIPNPINTNITIDIRIDNASNIWGWTIPTVAWNPAVLQLIAVKEGPFLADNTGSDPTAFAGAEKGLWDNVSGSINGGLSEAIYGSVQSTDSSGVVATLTFNVTGYGNSAITISGANLRTTPTDTVGVSAICNSAYIYETYSGSGSGRMPYED